MIPKGFFFNAVSCGIKAPDRLDLGLIYCPQEAVCAGVFTRNLVKAAPVLLGQEIVKKKVARAILVNSGCANACTGERGLEQAQTLLKALAQELDLLPDSILPASTGVIGAYLPLEKMLPKLRELGQGLAPDKYELVARAMMTTDTFPKVVTQTVEIGQGQGQILGLAKGAGMIAPNMATMLAFILSDVEIPAEDLEGLLKEAVARSFNRITVDGDTSTNDTVYALASGKSGLSLTAGSQGYESFKEAFIKVCRDLAYLIVKDGEGANKTVCIKVAGAKNEDEAEILAKTVANSLLVKTAIFGEDPNWGRILAAMGRCGVFFNPYRVNIFIGPIQIVKDGLGLGTKEEQKAHEIMTKDEFDILIDLQMGHAQAEIITCDLSYDYVKINAEYRT